MATTDWLQMLIFVGGVSFAAGVLVTANALRGVMFYRSPPPRGRVKRILVNAEIMPELFTQGKLGRLHFDGMPDDAMFIGATYQVEGDRFEFLVTSMAFEPIEDGDDVPQFDVTIREVRIDDLTGFKEN